MQTAMNPAARQKLEAEKARENGAATGDRRPTATDDKCECRYRQRKGFSKAARKPASQLPPLVLSSALPPSSPSRAPVPDNPDIKDVLPFPARSGNNKTEMLNSIKRCNAHISPHFQISTALEREAAALGNQSVRSYFNLRSGAVRVDKNTAWPLWLAEDWKGDFRTRCCDSDRNG